MTLTCEGRVLHELWDTARWIDTDVVGVAHNGAEDVLQQNAEMVHLSFENIRSWIDKEVGGDIHSRKCKDGADEEFVGHQDLAELLSKRRLDCIESEKQNISENHREIDPILVCFLCLCFSTFSQKCYCSDHR